MIMPVRFLLNGLEEVAVCAAPDLTILQWLRSQRQLTGTKEGCAEGDCGACTVALAERDDDGRLRWRAANGCILLMGQIHGKLLVTVEGLAEGRALHPVQQAMIDEHASQCGFCTPGFVMALFAAFRSGAPHDLSAIHDSIAGNLCRCTGYRPIVAAAEKALAQAPLDRFAPLEAEIAQRLAALAEAPALMSDGLEGAFAAPRSRAELAAVLAARPQARIVAGGTDLALDVTKRHMRLSDLVSVASVAELRLVEARDDALVIGAAATYADLLPVLARIDPSVETLLRRLGSRQIRSLGTIGGNLANASPIGDTPPVLLALGADVVLGSAAGERTIPLDDFFLAYRKTALRPGEFVDRVIVPLPRPGEVFRVDKVSRRFDQDISAVCGAVLLRLEGEAIAQARIAFGGMAATPARALNAEAALTGSRPTQEAFAAAADALAKDFQPIDDFRASAAYRMRAARNLMERWRLAASGADLEAAQ